MVHCKKTSSILRTVRCKIESEEAKVLGRLLSNLPGAHALADKLGTLGTLVPSVNSRAQ